MKNIQKLIKIVEEYYDERKKFYIEYIVEYPYSITIEEIEKFYKDRLEHCIRMLNIMENIMFTYPNHFTYEKYQAILAAIILHDIEKYPRQFIEDADIHAVKGAIKAEDILAEFDEFKDNIRDICEAIGCHSDKNLSEEDVKQCDIRYILVCLDIADKLGPNTLYINVAKNPLITYDELFAIMKDLYMKVNSIINLSNKADAHNPIRTAIIQLLKTRNSQLLDIITAFQLNVKFK